MVVIGTTSLIVIIIIIFVLFSRDNAKGRRIDINKMVADHPEKYELHPKYNMYREIGTKNWRKF